PFIIDNNEIQVTASIGISIYPDDGREAATLIRKADIAMQRSRSLGMGESSIHSRTLDIQTQEHFWMKNDLARAISRDELFLNYQPIYDINQGEGELVGVEALLRWKNENGKIISPSKFIQLAERMGLIHSIGDWVLMNACKQNRKWQDQGHRPIYISVNISILQLEQPGFDRIVERILEESGLDPEYLHLEITETFFTQNYRMVNEAIGRLSRLGIRLSIDDFGTGYSSLSQLCQFNIHNLKIDRSFIDGVDNDENKSKIVKAVISLANSLKVGLIAEGVETRAQLNFLKNNECNIVQGYLFSKPIDTEQIERILIGYE
ncbi:MAG: EAL domain-containing protein, partial [Tissierellia bacterium]|nr:EAL domain-containing protein [Tissierellia bacterium]